MKSKKTLTIDNLGFFILALLIMIACQIPSFECNNAKKLSSFLMVEHNQGELQVIDQYFNCCSFLSINYLFPMKRFVYGVLNPLFGVCTMNEIVYKEGGQSMVQWVTLYYFFVSVSNFNGQLRSNSLKNGSPKHSFYVFSSYLPRSCNVSVFCRWTIPKAHKKLRPILISKTDSCRCGRKRATCYISVKEGSQRYYLSRRWTILEAITVMIKRNNKKIEEERIDTSRRIEEQKMQKTMIEKSKTMPWYISLKEGSPRHYLSCRWTIFEAIVIMIRRNNENIAQDGPNRSMRVEEQKMKKMMINDPKTALHHYALHQFNLFQIIYIILVLLVCFCFSVTFVASDFENRMQLM